MKSIIDEALARHEESKSSYVSPDDEALKALVETLRLNVKIVGCGGGGSNTINRLTAEGVSGAQLCAINTDATHLLQLHVPKKMLIGRRATKGLGAGALPEIGESAAMENEEEIANYFEGAHIAFVTAGMGGGTGTGSAPYVARLAKNTGALTLGVVTMPFKAEGHLRQENAVKGLDRLRDVCDTTIAISNDKLLEMVPRLPIDAAFKVADEVLMTAIKGITEVITKPGMVNIDFSDLRTIMENGGLAMIGIGGSDSERERVDDAVNEALTSPLLGNMDLSDAKGALIRVMGGNDMTIGEAQRAAELISAKISPSARIIWGCSVDPSLEGKLQVLIVITGVKSPEQYLLGVQQGAKGGGLDQVQ